MPYSSKACCGYASYAQGYMLPQCCQFCPTELSSFWENLACRRLQMHQCLCFAAWCSLQHSIFWKWCNLCFKWQQNTNMKSLLADRLVLPACYSMTESARNHVCCLWTLVIDILMVMWSALWLLWAVLLCIAGCRQWRWTCQTVQPHWKSCRHSVC